MKQVDIDFLPTFINPTILMDVHINEIRRKIKELKEETRKNEEQENQSLTPKTDSDATH